MLISDYLVPKKPKKNRKIIIIGLLVTGVLSAALIIVTYFGFFTGTNYLLLDQQLGARGIELSKYKDLSHPTSQILIDPMGEEGLDEVDHRDIDFSVRDTHDQDSWFGIYTQKRNNVTHRYGMYQFYLINQSDISADTYTLNVSYFIEIVRSTNNIADALGIRLFVDEYDEGIVVKNEYDSGHIFKDDKYEPFPVIYDFKPKKVKRITIFFWLEGDFTTKEMVGGALRIRIRFNLAELENEGEL